MMHDTYQAAKAAACAPAIAGGADNLRDAHQAWDGTQAWSDGGLSDEALSMLAIFALLDDLEAA
jgi:hypothetical protein